MTTTKPLTLSDLKRLAETKDYNFEIHNRAQNTQMIGIELNRYVWHWFETYPEYMHESLTAPDEVGFDHTYSQTTGATKRGVNQLLKVQMRFKTLISKLP
jgi:hypothetical protein